MANLQKITGSQTWRKTGHGRNIKCRPLCELDALTTEKCMTNQAYLQQYGMFMKLIMTRTIA